MIALASQPLLAGNGNSGRTSGAFPRLGGHADWELYRSDNSSRNTNATFQAFRQRYTLDLTGAIYDFRFNRYALSFDFFRSDRKVNGRELDSQTIGYRMSSTFFPTRSFPLRLWARRTTTDAAGMSLADRDRETRSWGGEWNFAFRNRQRLRLHYDRTAYDLLSPVALEERRNAGQAEYGYRTDRRDTTLQYGFQDRQERVSGTEFNRRNATLTDRTRFANGMTFLINANHTLSDALFSTGVRDDLTIMRVSSVLDIPRKNRVGFNVGYDHNENAGNFVDATSDQLRANSRIRLGPNWEFQVGARAGRLDSMAGAVPTGQDLQGITAGIRFQVDRGPTTFSTSYNVGRIATEFDDGTDRTNINHAVNADLRTDVADAATLFSSLQYREDENDTSGVGYTFDLLRGEVGLEGRLGEHHRGKASIFHRQTTYDTFQFGVQDSTETGAQATWDHPDGGVTLTVSTQEGISDFIPDPGSGSPFIPGIDLVSRADVATAGMHWRLPARLRIRVQARYEDREFTSIGSESIRYYHPELEWSHQVWRIALGLSHYERDNSTSFKRDALTFRVSRRMF